jgi:hypothetical protein
VRFPSPSAKQRLNQFERDADTSQILIRIIAATLIWIQDSKRRRHTFTFIWQVVVGDDDVKSIVPGPVEWSVGTDAAVHADGQFVTLDNGFFQSRLLDAVSFSKTMRHMKSCARAQQVEGPQEQRSAGRAVHVVISIDQYWFSVVHSAEQTLDRLSQTKHQIWVVKLIEGRLEETLS